MSKDIYTEEEIKLPCPKCKETLTLKTYLDSDILQALKEGTVNDLVTTFRIRLGAVSVNDALDAFLLWVHKVTTPFRNASLLKDKVKEDDTVKIYQAVEDAIVTLKTECKLRITISKKKAKE